MDCSKLSDFDINKRIAELEGVRGFHCENVGGGSALKFTNWKELDYCNNPADAWPIIVGSKIGVREYDGWWEARTYIPEHAICDKNPLRAAMIVFLMMQESE